MLVTTAGLFSCLGAVARAETCHFPVAAAISVGGFVQGRTAQDAAVAVAIAGGLGPNAYRYGKADAPVTVLAMLPPAVWIPRYHDVMAAAVHKRWPKMTLGAFLDLDQLDRNPWLSQVAMGSSTEWIAGANVINAPSLGGVLSAGPTTCTAP